MANTSHVLARKYRPQVFADLIGQDALVHTITSAIMTDRLAHAYMLTGIRGIGKTSSARIIAKGLNCIGPDGKGGMTPNPCGQCPHCVSIANDSHMDVIEIDAASNTGVDNVREIIEGAKYNPVSARFKIYIIDEVHMLSKAAFNALLKTLEEPPERIKFIFATTEIRKVPITILSRCQRFDLRRLDEELLTNHLAGIAEKEKISFEPDALKLLARAGEGSVRDSLSLMDQAMTQLDGNLTVAGVRQMLGMTDKTVLFDLYEALLKGDIQTALKLLEEQYAGGTDPFELVQDLLNLTHWLTRGRLIPETLDDVTIPESERNRAKVLTQQLTMMTLTSVWQMLLKGVDEVRRADSPIKALEMLLVRVAFLSEMPSLATLAEDIKKKSIAVPQVEAKSSIIATKTGTDTACSDNRSSQQNGVSFSSLADIVALARQKGERVLAYHIETYVRPVELKDRTLVCSFIEGAGRDLCAKLTQFLNKATGTNWTLDVRTSGGKQTLHEVKEAKQNALLQDLKKTPLVSTALSAFNGAKIEKIKPLKEKTDFEETEIIESNTDLEE